MPDRNDWPSDAVIPYQSFPRYSGVKFSEFFNEFNRDGVFLLEVSVARREAIIVHS